MAELDAGLRGEIAERLARGEKVAAIKRVREATPGMSLAEAKDLVDKLHTHLHAQDPDRFPMPQKTGCGGAAALLLAVGGAAAWLAHLT